METSAGTACQPQLLTPLQLHTMRCLGPRATTTHRQFARKIQNWHPAASCAGALCIPKGICVRTGLQQGLLNREYVHYSHRSGCSHTHTGVYVALEPTASLRTSEYILLLLWGDFYQGRTQCL